CACRRFRLTERANSPSRRAARFSTADFFACLMQPPMARVSQASSFSLHFAAKTKMLALTIMAIRNSQPRLPFHVGFNAT
ncbi:MAG: hypothetical protein WBG18_25335, partial [Xanthobacteraceae bacterium]